MIAILIILYLAIFTKVAKMVRTENEIYIFAWCLIGMIVFALAAIAVYAHLT